MTSMDDMNAVEQWHEKKRLESLSARQLKREKKKKAKQTRSVKVLAGQVAKQEISSSANQILPHDR